MTASNNDQHIPIEELSAYADGEVLSDQERLVIEQHLAVCDECRAELESLRAVSSLLAHLPEPELPRSFRLTSEDVASTRSQAGPSEPVPIEPWIIRHQSLFRYAGLAAALLLVVIVTIDLIPDGVDETDEVFTTMEDAPEEEALDTEDAADPPGVMSVEEDADEPAIESAPESTGDAEVAEDQDAAEFAEEAAPEDLDDVQDHPVEVPEADDSDHPVAEPAPDDSDHPMAERAPDVDDAARLAADDEDEGWSTLQIAAIVLALLSVGLLLTGFVLPRWWSSSA
jgi:hypothetical protein